MGAYQAVEALGDPTRRLIFERLVAGPLAVGELAAGLPVSRPAVSQHLKVLKQARLVRDEAVGTRRVYRVDPAGVRELRDYFDDLWGRALDAFARAVEEER
ncbi:ArsR/SmtB family transcription factor [Actinosynnema sp. NPDC053489]|uniref:ArsR/SmtB family transcription factor n=1 Tax=Actinosynnema sp. NPDC053489 TaxID=3363916 RepID=UPI0037C62452